MFFSVGKKRYWFQHHHAKLPPKHMQVLVRHTERYTRQSNQIVKLFQVKKHQNNQKPNQARVFC